RSGARPDRAPGRRVLVDGVLEALAGLELRLGRSLDGHRFAGARVAAGRSLALGNREGAETDQTHFVALAERRRDRVEHGLDGLGRIALREAARVGDGADQIVLV